MMALFIHLKYLGVKSPVVILIIWLFSMRTPCLFMEHIERDGIARLGPGRSIVNVW